MATVLFAGWGDLGSAAGCLLRDAGRQVMAIKRTPAPPLPGIDYCYAELCAPLTLLPAQVAAVEVVVIVLAPARHDPDDYAATYVTAPQQLLRALQAAGAQPRQVLFVSSSSVWGAADEAWISEDAPAQPDGWNGEILLRAEAALLAWPWPTTVLRLSGIYGPGRLRLLRKAEAIMAGREVLPPPAWTNRIHRDDAARLIAFLVDRALAGTMLETLYIGTDNTPALNTEVLAWLILRLQAAGPELPTTLPVILPPPLPMTTATEVGGKRLSNARLRALGFAFHWPDYRAGYAAVLAGLKVRG